MGRIGIYGGTFNPPHRGHLLALREFQSGLHLDRILMIPDAVPPHKEMAEGSPDPETRLRLCRLAAAGLPFVEVSDMEIRRAGKSYTAVTITELKKRFPDDELVLLMGTDMFLTFHQWRNPEVIAANASLAMAHRRDASREERTEVEAQAARLKKDYGAAVTVLQNALFDVSSTTVRNLLSYRAGSSLLPEAVYREILRLGLYRTGEPLRDLPFEALKEASLSRHKPTRRRHAEGCCETAVALARRWGADEDAAARAGILHDVTKRLNLREQLILCEEYGIVVDDFYRQNDKPLHALTGAAVAARLFGETAAVADAIRYHTTGKARMTNLEKIIYLSDMIEPGRDFPGVETLRRQALENLDLAVLQALEQTVSFVLSKNAPLHPDSLEALTWQRNALGVSGKNTNEVNP